VTVTELESGEVIERYLLDYGPPLVAISPTGDKVAFTGVYDVRLRTIGSDREISLPIGGATCRSLRFLPNGEGIAAGCSYGTFRIWDL
jgi:hypothetical protein